MSDDVIILWEQPKLVPPEFRLYYDKSTCNVLFYSGSGFPETGDYIVIDAMTFVMARPDVRVIDGKISTVQAHAVVHKLMPELISKDGQECAAEDMSIIVNESYVGARTYWKMVSYEL